MGTIATYANKALFNDLVADKVPNANANTNATIGHDRRKKKHAPPANRIPYVKYALRLVNSRFSEVESSVFEPLYMIEQRLSAEQKHVSNEMNRADLILNICHKCVE